MSIQSLVNQIAAFDSAIHSIERQFQALYKQISSKQKEVNRILDKINREKDRKRLVSHQKELNGLFAREVSGEKVILPIWHKISKNEVTSYSPIIADLVALNTSNFTLEIIAKQIANRVKND